MKKICGWLNNTASTESKVAKRRWDLAVVKGRREGRASAAVMTNFLCSDLSEVSHEPPRGEKCSNRFHGKKTQTGEPVVLTSVWSLGLAACLAHWLSGCRPKWQAGLTVFFSGCCSGLSSLRLLADCLKGAEYWADFVLNSVLSNIEIISTTFVSHSIFTLVSCVRWNVDFLTTNDSNKFGTRM